MRSLAMLLDRLALDTGPETVLAQSRARLIEALQERLGAESGALLDPPSLRFGERGRIAGVGLSAGYLDPFLANRERWGRSLGRLLGVARMGPAIDTEVYSSHERERLCAYREVFLPQRARSILVASFGYAGRSLGLVVLKRHGRAPGFRPCDGLALRRLLPAIGLVDAAFQFACATPAARVHPCDAFDTLSRRESQVAQLACKGMRNAEIAAMLGTSCDTVKKQLRSVLQKANVSNRTELAMVWTSARG